VGCGDELTVASGFAVKERWSMKLFTLETFIPGPASPAGMTMEFSTA
jgi:hypothetical protein